MSDVHPFHRSKANRDGRSKGASSGLAKSRIGKITIRFEDRVLARPTSMHGAASWFKRNPNWIPLAEIFVNGEPATTEHFDTVTGEFRTILDQLQNPGV